MGNRHFPLPLALTLLLLPDAAPWARAGEGGGVLPDVLIQAEEKREASSEKPPLDLPLKEETPLEFALKTEEELRVRFPQEVVASTKFATGLSESPYAAVPANNRIVMAWKGEPAQVFFPAQELAKVHKGKEGKKGKSATSWEWVVADSAGRVFRRFAGEGEPPARLEFDGKGEGGEWLKVGQVYTGVLSYRDAAGASHTAMSRPFALTGLALKMDSGYVLLLSVKAVFGEALVKGAFAPGGRELLQDAAQIIQRHHPGLSIETAAYLRRADRAAAQSAAESCAKSLAQRLLIADEKVAASSQAGITDLDERLEIRVLHK
ncbi:MAG: hypothetical protein WCU88_04740 [Elusimicrobiota bacterium]|jgi:hypothetical protein